ncbi:MAG: polyribonucleotide nucleotidyltransferase [Acidimicrobiia bacterium]|nr:polyribonucleotide nucleotidyltransferase [Acidimicrobiia bacterium]
MADAIIVTAPISGTDKTLSFETGKLAFQSQGAVVAKIAGTEALVTANAAKNVREGMDFFPLTVDVEERMYAAGRIPGSFFRREGRPTDAAILACRLIDRPLRPSFADGFRNETQVVVTVMGSDKENPYDVLAINGASAALSISGIPFHGPIGAVRIAFSTDGTWIPHPTFQEVEESTFELIVAGRGVGDDVAIMMVEAGGTEKAWDHYEAGAPKVTEEVIADGLTACKVWIKESIDLQAQLVELVKAGRGITPLEFTPVLDYQDDVKTKVEALVGDALAQAGTIAAKAERNAATDAAIATAIAEMSGDFAGRTKEIKEAARSIQKAAIRSRTVNEGIRIDGRGPSDLRLVTSEVGVLGQAHGSGLFQRGETQVLSVLSLGMPKMDQLLDNLGDKPRKRYMHHYNMPPHANGETGRVGSPKRREIGHGLLAERALLPVVPSIDEWAYALRVVSEVLSSNGSTSMGSVCGSTLALMDGGVPIKAAVAGIAMGLIYEDGKYTTLTDILGTEDAFGDMDFKVAGTSEFVTALQLDTKIDGLPADVLAQALQQAKEARLAILEVMQKAIAEPRSEVGETAPKVVSFEIPIDKIGEVIGPKGKVINAIQAETGADISVDDDGMVGTVTIGSPEKFRLEEAERQIKLILNPPTADVGAVYPGRVVNITKFGAFVNILPGRDGLLHISKIGGGKRIDRVEDVFSLGDEVEVKVDDVDPNGKVSLSLAGAVEIPDSAVSSGGGDRGRDRAPREDRAPRAESSPAPASDTVSFEDSFESEAREQFGDLGPAAAPDGGGRGGERRGRSGGGGRR